MLNLSDILSPMLDTNWTSFLEWRDCLASRGVIHVWIVFKKITHATKEISIYISSFGGYVSRGRCVRGLIICNPFKSIPHDIFPTDLADIRIILIVLRPSALDISLQLGERHPSIIRRRNPPPSVEIDLADPLSVAVV